MRFRFPRLRRRGYDKGGALPPPEKIVYQGGDLPVRSAEEQDRIARALGFPYGDTVHRDHHGRFTHDDDG